MDAETVARLRGIIAKLSRQLNASATIEGLTPAQASALSLIANRGPLSLAELTELEGLNPTMVSRVVGRLDDAGFIHRLANPSDLRTFRVEITETGRALHARIREQRGRALSDCLDRLPAGQRQDLVSSLPALEALAEALKAAGPR